MKLILAIIRPERLEAVQAALQSVLDENDNYRLPSSLSRATASSTARSSTSELSPSDHA